MLFFAKDMVVGTENGLRILTASCLGCLSAIAAYGFVDPHDLIF
jgi:hypothetical protein